MARQVLPIVGAVVGGYFGGPQGAQIGFAIGSIVGNAVDPQRLAGPKIGEVAVQTAEEGAVCPLYAGTCAGPGNLIYKHLFDPVIVEEQQGKGGGPIIESERLYGTFAVRIGASLFDGPGVRNGITGLVRIWEDEKLVYDVSPTSTILDESAEYANGFTFYIGDETQLPDPDIEAIEGVGNVPAYRGRAYIVFNYKDLTDRKGSVPQFRFEVSVTSTTTASGGGWLFGPTAINGASGGSEDYYLRADTLEELPFATPTAIPAWISAGGGFTKISRAQNGTLFMYGADNTRAAVSFDGAETWVECVNADFNDSRDVTWNGNYYYHSTIRSSDGITWGTTPNLPSGTDYIVAREFFNNPIVAVQNPSSGGSAQISVSLDDGGTWENYPPSYFSNWSISNVVPGHLQFKFTLDSSRGRYTDDLFEVLRSEGVSFAYYKPFYSDDFARSWIRKTTGGLIFSEDGSANWVSTLSIAYSSINDNNVAYGNYLWAALRVVAGSPQQHFININNGGGGPGDWTEVATPMYGNGGNIIYCGAITAATVTTETASLPDVIEAIVRRVKQPASLVDTSAVSGEIVRGIVFGSQDYTAVDALRSLSQVYLYDVADYDEQLHIVPRGGAVEFSITEDDLVEAPGDSFVRANAIEQPGKISLFFQNPTIYYQPSKVNPPFIGYENGAVNEVTVQVPVVLRDSDEAPQLVDKMQKISETDAQGEITRVVSDRFLSVVPSSVGAITERGITRRIRVTGVEEYDYRVKLKMRIDRQSAVTSNITATPVPAPDPPPSSIVGQTVFAFLNIPGISDSDDKLGYRFAVAGISDGWHGAALQRKSGAETDYTTVATKETASVMGTLVSSVTAASEHVTDYTNVVRVYFPNGETIESLTYQQFLSEGGGFAIDNGDGTWELCQYQDAAEDSDGIVELSTLVRGRGNTGATAHSPGAAVVMLTSTQFVEASSAIVGLTLSHRPVSIGSSPETAVVYANAYDPAYSQVEMPVSQLRAERDGSDVLTIEWAERRRFGTVRLPVRSLNWLGFRIVLDDGSATVTLPDQTADSVVYDASALGPSVTVSVYQINRITGLGPASEVTV